MFDDNVKSMPEWKLYNLDKKIKISLGANYSVGYAEKGVEEGGARPGGITHANYVGARWELKEKGLDELNEEGMHKTLVGLHTSNLERIDGYCKKWRELKAKGVDYDLYIYEGGPSGFVDFMSCKWTTPCVIYSKTHAMAVAALDTWLYCSQEGFRFQNYYSFAVTPTWGTHITPPGLGFRPTPSWQAYKIRNKFAKGKTMLRVETNCTPTYAAAKMKGKRKLKETYSVPLIGVYCFKDGNTYSVFVLSRKIDKFHRADDDGFTPVTLHMPFANATKISLHRLAHPDGSDADPRDTNLKEMKLKILSQDINVADFTKDFVINEKNGGGKNGLPPGAIYCYVFEGTGQ